MSAPPADEDAIALFDILTGRCRAQAVSAAAQLGLADTLVAGPLSAQALAQKHDCDSSRLERLLLYLVSIEVCSREGKDDDDQHTYGLTSLGRTLTADALGPLASYLGSPEQWDPWSRLADSLRPGAEPAFALTHGTDLYAYMAENDPAAARYDLAIESFTRQEALALVEVLDLSNVKRLVDLGGGRGTLLTTLLQRWPELTGVLVDLPDVLTRTLDHVPAGVVERLEVAPGDFLKAVPQGADAYLLSHVIHNWDDAQATALLTRCAQALPPGGRVFVLECLLLPGDLAHRGRHLDLEMLIVTGGKERSKIDLRRLFTKAGLKLEPVQAVSQSSWLLVGKPR
ncbi:MAG: SAM-dependent methyltransferase [Pseudohongiellaceae bacterium]